MTVVVRRQKDGVAHKTRTSQESALNHLNRGDRSQERDSWDSMPATPQEGVLTCLEEDHRQGKMHDNANPFRRSKESRTSENNAAIHPKSRTPLDFYGFRDGSSLLRSVLSRTIEDTARIPPSCLIECILLRGLRPHLRCFIIFLAPAESRSVLDAPSGSVFPSLASPSNTPPGERGIIGW